MALGVLAAGAACAATGRGARAPRRLPPVARSRSKRCPRARTVRRHGRGSLADKSATPAHTSSCETCVETLNEALCSYKVHINQRFSYATAVWAEISGGCGAAPAVTPVPRGACACEPRTIGGPLEVGVHCSWSVSSVCALSARDHCRQRVTEAAQTQRARISELALGITAGAPGHLCCQPTPTDPCAAPVTTPRVHPRSSSVTNPSQPDPRCGTEAATTRPSSARLTTQPPLPAAAMSFEEVRADVEGAVRKLKGLVPKIQTGNKDEVRVANSDAARLVKGARAEARPPCRRAARHHTCCATSEGATLPASASLHVAPPHHTHHALQRLSGASRRWRTRRARARRRSAARCRTSSPRWVATAAQACRGTHVSVCWWGFGVATCVTPSSRLLPFAPCCRRRRRRRPQLKSDLNAVRKTIQKANDASSRSDLMSGRQEQERAEGQARDRMVAATDTAVRCASGSVCHRWDAAGENGSHWRRHIVR
jgi:hypothetical protein